MFSILLIVALSIFTLTSASINTNINTSRTVVFALKQQNVIYKVLDRTAHDDDHPISFAEGAYLKTIYFKISQ